MTVEEPHGRAQGVPSPAMNHVDQVEVALSFDHGEAREGAVGDVSGTLKLTTIRSIVAIPGAPKVRLPGFGQSNRLTGRTWCGPRRRPFPRSSSMC